MPKPMTWSWSVRRGRCDPALRAARAGPVGTDRRKGAQVRRHLGDIGRVMWIPNHGLNGSDDSREQALSISAASPRPASARSARSLRRSGARDVRFLAAQGVTPIVATWPDYYPDKPGARSDRSIIFGTFDGRELGDKFTLMREQFTRFKLLNRYAMDLAEFFVLSARSPGGAARCSRCCCAIGSTLARGA